LCWNRQLDLVPYLERVRDLLAAWAFAEDEQRANDMIRLLAKKPWKKGSRSGSREREEHLERRDEPGATVTSRETSEHRDKT
jgi:hypothetical protein